MFLILGHMSLMSFHFIAFLLKLLLLEAPVWTRFPRTKPLPLLCETLAVTLISRH